MIETALLILKLNDITQDHEAVPGDVIDQVRARFNQAKGFKVS